MGERCVGLPVVSPGSVSISNTSFDHLRHRGRLPQATDGRPRELKTPKPRSGRKNGGTSRKASHSRSETGKNLGVRRRYRPALSDTRCTIPVARIVSTVIADGKGIHGKRPEEQDPECLRGSRISNAAPTRSFDLSVGRLSRRRHSCPQDVRGFGVDHPPTSAI